MGSVTDKGDGAVMPKIMFLYIRLCYSRFETDSPADFEEVAAILWESCMPSSEDVF